MSSPTNTVEFRGVAAGRGRASPTERILGRRAECEMLDEVVEADPQGESRAL